MSKNTRSWLSISIIKVLLLDSRIKSKFWQIYERLLLIRKIGQEFVEREMTLKIKIYPFKLWRLIYRNVKPTMKVPPQHLKKKAAPKLVLLSSITLFFHKRNQKDP